MSENTHTHDVNQHLRYDSTSDDAETIRQHRGVSEAQQLQNANQSEASESNQDRQAESNNGGNQQS